MSPPRTRFAPSPTGDLHLGGAWAALASWAIARAGDGTFVVRVEDIDTPRVVPGAEARILEDLAWLGLDADEAPSRQSERSRIYEEALAVLSAQGSLYACDCSRADIARVASAPHAGEEVVYPGTCRDKDRGRPMRKEPAQRFRVESHDRVPLTDMVMGELDPELVVRAGDFVLRRGDGIFAYQLAVAVDDLSMGITHVVRGADLLPSTPRQLLLMRALSSNGALAWAPRDTAFPRYAHIPLVVDRDGERLAKRTPLATIRALRGSGSSAVAIVGRLAFGLGLAPTDRPLSAEDLAADLRGKEIRFDRARPPAVVAAT
jgi:glutamyl-tRNA synthetase